MREAAGEIAHATLPAPILQRAISALSELGFAVEYLELRDATTLAPLLDTPSRPARLLAAIQLGRTRLIDNVPLT
jgi:pantoate--beta-alanine ligase